jgi:hypothetical protein
MTFDQIRAQTEMVAGLTDVFRLTSNRAKLAERNLAEAEAEYNAMTKLNGFVEGLLSEAQTKLRALREQHEK